MMIGKKTMLSLQTGCWKDTVSEQVHANLDVFETAFFHTKRPSV